MNERSALSTPELKAVPRARGNLATICDILHERLDELDKVLVSVSRSHDPTTSGTESKEAKEPQCPLAGTIDDLGRRVSQACSRVEDIINRLEL